MRRMARKLRIQYRGAIYHVMNRGDRQEPIFEDDADRERFLETLAAIGFCSRCYDRELFDGLEPDEVSALHWAFGRCDAEDPPEIIEKKIARLLVAVEGLPCGEVFVALAYAYHLAGRKTEAHTWA